MNFFPGIFLAAIALSATTAGGAILAGRLIGSRVAKTREAEFRAMFAAEPPADPAREVEVLLSDGSRRVAWYRPPLGWIDADSLRTIDRRDVVEWREPPFAKDADDDPAPWSIERALHADFERRFPPKPEDGSGETAGG